MMPLSASEALSDYHEILKEKRLPGYLKSKSVGTDIELNAESERLWEEHERLVASPEEPGNGKDVFPSLLDLKLELAKRTFHDCELCERRCKVNRTEKKGVCKTGSARVASKFVHWGEEPELIPSYTIFFSRCTFKCIFCQNWDISQFDAGGYIDPNTLASDIERKFGSVRNVNWVGGEPTPNLPYILEVLTACSARTPQVWNSNMYMSTETMALLGGVADLYLTDFKYGNDECAQRLSNVPDYFHVVSRNHKLANGQCEMIIRHLVMPGHADCCSEPILDWISENLDLGRVRVNVMDQYRPRFRASEAKELRSPLSPKEFFAVHEYAKSLDLNLVE
jgi:putative pyruvate formate lyase activating enzyme